MAYFVYILTNKNNKVLYTGITNDIGARLHSHESKANPNSFTARYNVNKLVYCESFDDVSEAIAREKQIKAGSRSKKIALIEGINPKWQDMITAGLLF